MLEPPYGEVADLLKRGQVVPLLGAGVNFGQRPPGAAWDEKTATFLPSGAELSRALAKRVSFPSRDDGDLSDLARVASYFVDASARKRLRERLHQVFDRDFEPCAIHTYLASVPAPMLIVTTNYDDLTERAFRAVGRPFDLVVHPTDRRDVEASVLWWRHGEAEPEAIPPNRLLIDLDETTVIYKMHGTVDRAKGEWDSYVITEEDYVDFLARMADKTAVPSQFMRHFRTRHFLFLGYGLRDWNLRVVLRNLKGLALEDEREDDELTSWAIQFRPSDLDVKLWSSRDVEIYDVDINEFVKRLREEGDNPGSP